MGMHPLGWWAASWHAPVLLAEITLAGGGEGVHISHKNFRISFSVCPAAVADLPPALRQFLSGYKRGMVLTEKLHELGGIYMYTAIRHYKMTVKSLDAETLQRVENEFVPILRSTDGFVGYHIAEAGDNEIVTVGVFETAEGAEASRVAAASWVNDNLAHLIAEPPNVLTGEVIVSARR